MKVPVYNRTDRQLELCLEPEGDVFVLGPGEKCEPRMDAIDDLELEVHDGAFSVWCSERKTVWRDGRVSADPPPSEA